MSTQQDVKWISLTQGFEPTPGDLERAEKIRHNCFRRGCILECTSSDGRRISIDAYGERLESCLGNGRVFVVPYDNVKIWNSEQPQAMGFEIVVPQTYLLDPSPREPQAGSGMKDSGLIMQELRIASCKTTFAFRSGQYDLEYRVVGDDMTGTGTDSITGQSSDPRGLEIKITLRDDGMVDVFRDKMLLTPVGTQAFDVVSSLSAISCAGAWVLSIPYEKWDVGRLIALAIYLSEHRDALVDCGRYLP